MNNQYKLIPLSKSFLENIDSGMKLAEINFNSYLDEHRGNRWYGVYYNGIIVGHVAYRQLMNGVKNIYSLRIRPDFEEKEIEDILLKQVGEPNINYKEDRNKMDVNIYPSRPFMMTYTGKVVKQDNLKAEDICIEDISHSLACINRWNGHLSKPISVAQHAVAVSKLCEQYGEDTAWEALHHDDGEAYVSDINKWIKQVPEMSYFRNLEDNIMKVIRQVMGVKDSEENTKRVHEADWDILRFERIEGYGKLWGKESVGGIEPLTENEEKDIRDKLGKYWRIMNWRDAEQLYMIQFRKLRGAERMAEVILNG